MRFYENSRNVFLKNQHPTLRNIPFSRILTYLFHFFPADRTRYFYKIFERIFSFKKKKKYQKNEFHLSGIFRNISLGRIIFFFRTNFLSQPQHGGFAKGEESNIIFKEKWASQADYLGILVELKLFPLFSRHFIAFIFFEIHIFLLKMEPELSFQLYPLLFSYNTRKYKSWSLNLDIRCYPPLHRFRFRREFNMRYHK